MKNTNTGGPAFPCDLTAYDPEVQREMQGMTLRDYFAAKALQAMMTRDVLDGLQYSGFGRESYRMADEMLKARGA